ncbi:alpha/beta hydrolase [Nisaea sp.]|uniref:alpha/beta fold hydrolase n=2 Tax=Nisaea sp. TaxID=2024842 RepID=UPI003263A53A
MMAFATFEGSRVSYKVDGSGPALVLIHGTGGDAETNWGALTERLQTNWTLVRPDYSGSGETTDDGRELSVDYVAEQVLAAVDAAGIERFHLMGFSLGALIAAWIGARQPERVKSLILLAGFQSADDVRARLQFGLWEHLIRTDREAMARLVMMTGFSSAALAAMGEEGVREAVAMIASTSNWDGMARQIALDLKIDVREEVQRLRQPVLVVGCRQDQMIPPLHSEFLAEAIVGAERAELDSGHLAPMECPDELAVLVSGFLRRREESAGDG